jgi:hypothetical protein
VERKGRWAWLNKFQNRELNGYSGIIRELELKNGITGFAKMGHCKCPDLAGKTRGQEQPELPNE